MSKCIWMPIAAEVALSPRNSLSRRYQLLTIGKAASKRPGHNVARPVPALQKQPQREPDSSDEEEERALALGAEGK